MSVLYIQDHRKHCFFTILLQKKMQTKPQQTEQNPKPTDPAILCSIAIVSDIMQYPYDFIVLAAIVSLINNLMSS